MPKAYWISVYRQVHDAGKLAEYAKLAGPAIEAGGGRFLARGLPARTFEGTAGQRAVVIEFDSVDAAVATYESARYRAALAALEGAAERDVRIVAGAE